MFIKSYTHFIILIMSLRCETYIKIIVKKYKYIELNVIYLSLQKILLNPFLTKIIIMFKLKYLSIFKSKN